MHALPGVRYAIADSRSVAIVFQLPLVCGGGPFAVYHGNICLSHYIPTAFQHATSRCHPIIILMKFFRSFFHRRAQGGGPVSWAKTAALRLRLGSRHAFPDTP